MNLLIYLGSGKVTKFVTFTHTKSWHWVKSKAGLIKNKFWAWNQDA